MLVILTLVCIYVTGCDAATISAAPTSLRWYDITTMRKFPGGASKYQVIVDVDLSKMHRLSVYDGDPYWIKYYASFWRSGRYISSDFTNVPNTAAKCEYNEHWVRKSPFHLYKECYAKFNRNGIESGVWIDKKYVKEIVVAQPTRTYLPNQSSLGPNYYASGSYTDGTTLNFIMFLNRQYDPKIPGATPIWRYVRPGEVTEDGYGIVPMNNTVFGQWLFIVPAADSREIRVSKCRPGILGCSSMVLEGGPIYIHDPPLWTNPGEDERNYEKYIASEHPALGGGDDIAAADIAAEGFYILEAENTQYDHYTYTKITSAEVKNKLQEIPVIEINGSGNNLANGLAAGALMAAHARRSKAIFYYMPVRANIYSYSTEHNVALRDSLKDIFAYSRDNNRHITIYTHSWAGYVVTTSCANMCANVAHVSYAPATMPQFWRQMRAGYAEWRDVKVYYSSRDLLSGFTYEATAITVNSNGAAVSFQDVHTGHSLANIIAHT